MRVHQISNYSQNYNNSPNFGVVNTKYIGEFNKPSNKKRAEKVIDAVTSMPEFIAFSKNRNLNIVLDAQPHEYLVIHKRDSLQKTLDFNLSILYEKPDRTIVEKFKKLLKPTKKIEISKPYINEIALSDEIVKRFINFIKSSKPHSLRYKLLSAQEHTRTTKNKK